MEASNQEHIQREIARISGKKRRERTSRDKVRLLQLKLYLKAKQESSYKFYILYDKIFQSHILKEAYERVKSNGGSPGIDGKKFVDIEEEGLQAFLDEIQEELRPRSYKPQAVKHVWIEKPNGGQRPLGIPTIKDRVAQQACKIVIEPIFEADFDDSSQGFRPNKSTHEAIREIKTNLKGGKHKVYDADLSKYFDTIPHEKLLIVLSERIADPRVLHLIKLWLKTPIQETDGRYTGGKGSKRGTPQGGVISPLLANVYMNLLDRIVNRPGGYFSRLGIHMIRYADDFILMSRHINQTAIGRLHEYLQRMDLVINTTKSKVINAKEESFDFLGFRFNYEDSLFNRNQKYWNIYPQPESQKRLRQNINDTLKNIGHHAPEFVSMRLNSIIQGWVSSYKIDKVSYLQITLKKLEDYLRKRLFRYYNRKSQRGTTLYGSQVFDMLVERHGLIKPYKSSGRRPVNVLR